MSSSTGTPDIFASGSVSDDDDDDEVMSEIDPDVEGQASQPAMGAEVEMLPERRSPTRRVQVSSSESINELSRVEEKLAEILGHASSAIALYSEPPDEVDQDSDSPDSLASILKEYYSSVDDVQRTLRTSIAQLRIARISPRILFQSGISPSPSTHPSSVGIGDQRRSYAAPSQDSRMATDSDGRSQSVDLSLEATVIEKQAWTDALEALKGFGSPTG